MKIPYIYYLYFSSFPKYTKNLFIFFRDDVNALGDFSDDDADLAGHEVLLHHEGQSVSHKKVPPPVAPKPVAKQRSTSVDEFDDAFDDDIDIVEVDNARQVKFTVKLIKNIVLGIYAQ